MKYQAIETPIGRLLVVGDHRGLHQILFDGATPDPTWEPGGSEDAVEQLRAYFAGELTRFSLLLAPRGTAFQNLVWDQLLRIPYGETTHYGAIAAQIGKPKASRAVGLANGSNPIPIVVPCHRVIGKNGALTGFAGGIGIKRQLLHFERGPAQGSLFE